jgi:hypothetical protein
LGERDTGDWGSAKLKDEALDGNDRGDYAKRWHYEDVVAVDAAAAEDVQRTGTKT